MQMQDRRAVAGAVPGRTEAELGKLDDAPQWES